MRLLRIQVENFRNFRDASCSFGSHVVLLGENGVGKTNLLHAMRLVLDSELADSERYLDEDDFWRGVPPFAGTQIAVTLDLTGYAEDLAVLACLGDHEVPAPAGHAEPVARLTYRYAPRTTIDPTIHGSTTKADYEFSIYGKDDPSNELRRDVRRFLAFRLLRALRDAEADLRTWRRSPLRPLLEEATAKMSPTALENAAKAMDAATSPLTQEAPLVALRDQIAGRINEMIGEEHRLTPSLGFTSTNVRHLVRSLKLFVDDRRTWEVSDMSLGLANVIYLGLLLLHVQHQESAREAAAIMLGIEEPEAHLHPQMQRQVFRDVLRGARPVVVSTHSPNVASVAPVDSLVVLRREGEATTLRSFADATGFTSQQIADLQHYLDVTRAEILFGRTVILVEGDAEQFLVPQAARLLDPTLELDDHGITVCSVAGTDFVPYARFLHQLGIPFVVLTDADARDVTETGKHPGTKRAVAILDAIGESTASLDKELNEDHVDECRQEAATRGIFFGRRTLEVDLLEVGAGPRMATTFSELRPQTEPSTLAPFQAAAPLDDAGEDKLIGLILRQGVGKGRFAQRFAASMLRCDVPPYVEAAIRAAVAKAKHA